VIENFNDETIEARLNDRPEKIPARGWSYQWK
jgi:hypothetical protein